MMTMADYADLERHATKFRDGNQGKAGGLPPDIDKPRAISQADMRKFHDLRKQGHSVRECGRIMGRTKDQAVGIHNAIKDGRMIE